MAVDKEAIRLSRVYTSDYKTVPAVILCVTRLIVYFAKGEPRNVEYCKVFLWKYNIWVLRTRKLPDAKFFIHSILRNWPNYMLIR